MKFINYLESISGVAIFPLISLSVFFIFFILLTVWTFTIKKSRLTELENLPFDKPVEKKND